MPKINPKVSIVIPVYNGSNYLKEAIDSALAQTYKNIEVIVINDGSNDRGATEKIAKSYGNKIRYFLKENGGVATALNLSIEKMKGDFFSWLSHDDLYAPTKIEDQVSLWQSLENKNTIVASNINVLFEEGVSKKEKINADTFAYIDIFLATSARVGLNGCSLLIPRSAFTKTTGFRNDLPVTQDYDMWFRLKDSYDFILLEKHLVSSRRHQNQDSVRMHDRMREDGDRLHASFLDQIDQDRFNQYFSDSQKNCAHMYDNYVTYRSRGYYRTAGRLLKIILQYYYGAGKKRYHDMYHNEINKVLHDGANSQSPTAIGELNGMLTVFESIFRDEYETKPDSTKSLWYSRVIGIKNRFMEDGFFVTLKRIAKKRFGNKKND